MEAGYLAFLWVGRHILGFYYMRGTPVINPWTGEARQPWLTTHLGEGYSYSKPTAREPCWHCLNLLDHGGWISCFFMSREAHSGFLLCVGNSGNKPMDRRGSSALVDNTPRRGILLLQTYIQWPCWHCLTLLDHGGWISCFFMSREAHSGVLLCEGNSGNKLMDRRGSSALVDNTPRRGILLLQTYIQWPCWHCLTLLDHGGWISCFFMSREAHSGVLLCEGNSGNKLMDRRGSSALVDNTPRRGILLLQTYIQWPCWHCLTLLDHGGWISCFFMSREAHSGVLLCEGNSGNKPMDRRGSSALVDNSPRRGILLLQAYSQRTLLALSQLVRPWRLNLLLFYE